MFHISDIKLFSKCPKNYFLNKKFDNTYINFFRNEYNIVDIYKELFDIDNCFVGKTGDNPSLVLDNLGKYDYFINARFATCDLRVKASLLKRNLDGFSLYFFKPMKPKDLDINSFFVTYDVLKRNNIYVNSIYIIYVNSEYYYKEKPDFKEAMIITDTFNGENIFDTVVNCTFNYDDVITNLKKNDDNNSLFNINRQCGSCEYFEECFGKLVDDDSIMHLVSSKFKYDMYSDGFLKLKDADINRIDGTSLQYAQIMASRNDGLFVDKIRLKQFLESFSSETISFIDFEWDCFLFPMYEGMKSFDLLPFEYSLYIKKGTNISNYNYVGKGDCRKQFIEYLIMNLPDSGPIVAYNSFSAEVLRLQELSMQFPEYKDKLKSIAERFVDLAEVFSKGMVYDIRFKGQLSLKHIDSVISNITYNNLNVKNGLDAVVSFRKYELTNDENIKEDLIKYCNQDAYSLIVIYNYLLSLL